ncbi:MAG: FMN-binding protein [Sedimentisphaerales bacterium]|nr:FMN-binding protein [Sedimentisphaerales bacterium]
MAKIKNFIQQSWLLIVASFCFGLLIAITNAAWSPQIEQNRIEKINRLMRGLLPKAECFVLAAQIEVKSPKGKIVKSNIYKAMPHTGEYIGWAFNVAGPGFADKIELMIAVDRDFKKIAGLDCLASNETPGFGDRIKNSYFRSQFKGAPAELLELFKTGNPEKIDSEIVAITGATVSSEAVVKIINNAMSQVKTQMLKKGLIGNVK